MDLDRIDTQLEYDLHALCTNDNADIEQTDSPFDLCNNTCKYYEPDEVKTVLSDNPNSLKMFCLNCQGLRSHWDSFQDLIYEMGNNRHKFDFIGITELFSMSKGECFLPGYHALEFTVRNDSNSSKGGIGIYINDSYTYKIRKDLSIFMPNIFESIFLEVTVAKKHIIIGTVYRPNTFPKADLDIFMHTMHELQNLLTGENKDIYIIGDMNINLLKFSDHIKTGEYLEDTFSQGFLPLITKPTRITSHSATLIDHIYTNKLDINATSGIIINDISDHFGIFTCMQHTTYRINKAAEIKMSRSYSQRNVDKFNDILCQNNYNQVLEENCPNIAYNKFMDIYLEAFNRAFPLQQRKIAKKYIKRSPWMTKGLIQSSITKAKLIVSKIKRPNELNVNKYKKFCSIYNKLLRKSKYIYYQEKFQLAKHSMKETWLLLRSAINSKKNHTALPENFKHNNTILDDKRKISDTFNKYFANIGHDINELVGQSQHIYSDYMRQQNQNSIFLDPVSPADIVDITNKIKTKTSNDCNNISSKLMKSSINNIKEPLTHIVNLSLSMGVVPNEMKVAKVIPIFKTGDRMLFNNYRPISMLPVFSKILEKIMAKKIMTFLENSNQLYQHQYGFRTGHTTIHPMIHLLNKVAQENDKVTKNITMTVFADLSKAFDTISHHILLKKLDHMGIRGVANSWFASYLSNRTQYMDMYTLKSQFEIVQCGVPQGSILGPILFLIYINDIHNSTPLNVLCFADDTTISYSSSNVQNLYDTMNQELDNMNEWFRANKLCLNVSKTKYIIFKPSVRPRNNYHQSLKIDNQTIERIGNDMTTKSYKFLGIHIDETISWKDHIKKICNKISRANYIMNKVKNTIPKTCLLILYQSIVQCHINYGLELWGASAVADRVYKLQKRSIRIANKKSYRYHTEPLFKQCQILKIKDQYKVNVAIMMHKLKNGNLPASFEDLDYFSTPERSTRQTDLARHKRARTQFSALLPYHTFPNIWNEIEAHNRNTINKNKFKRDLQKNILQKYQEHIVCINSRCQQCFPPE